VQQGRPNRTRDRDAASARTSDARASVRVRSLPRRLAERARPWRRHLRQHGS